MRLVRVWLVLLTFVAVAMTVVAWSTPRPLSEDLERELALRLERSQSAATLLLELTSREWIDTATHLARDSRLIEALDQMASRAPADPTMLHKTAQEQLRAAAAELHADVLIAIDVKGRVLARVGPSEDVWKDAVDGMPVIADALRGYRADDTWFLDGHLYRVAVAPVIGHDRYLGALVVGQEMAAAFAESLKRSLGGEVAFVVRGRVVGTTSDAAALAQLPVIADREAPDLKARGRSNVVPLGNDREYLVGMAPLFGQARAQGAVVAVLAKNPRPATWWSLVDRVLAKKGDTLKPLEWGLVLGGLVLALLIGLALVRLEQSRPLDRLEAEAQAVARGEKPRIDDHRHRGALQAIARAFNTALERIEARALASKPRVPETTRSGGAYALLDDAPRRIEAEAESDSEEAVRVAEAERAAAAQRQADDNFGASPMTVRARRGQLSATTPEGERVLPSGPPPAPPQSAPPPSAVDPTRMTGALPPLRSAALDELPTVEGRKRATSNIPVISPTPSLGVASARRPVIEEEETRASSAREVRSLLDQDAAVAAVGAGDLELEAVFHEFLETKQRLGESTEGVTLEKFVAKLQANREQMIAKYACKSVRFQVYVKDGKAALKATPV